MSPQDLEAPPQPEPAAGNLARAFRVDLVERPEDPGKLGGGDSGAIVAEADAHSVRLPRGADRHVGAGRELAGIVQDGENGLQTLSLESVLLDESER